jgi:hypothetical protein
VAHQVRLGGAGDQVDPEVQWVLATGKIDRVLREGSQVLGEETIPEEHRREESQDQEGNQGGQNVDHMVGNSLGMEEVVEDILEEVVGEHLEAAAAAVEPEDLDQAEARDETCSVDIAQLAIVLPGMAFETPKK